jgi:hypothetical protein
MIGHQKGYILRIVKNSNVDLGRGKEVLVGLYAWS